MSNSVKRPASSLSHANVSETEIKRKKEDQVVLNVLLNCELTKSSETKQVQFQSLPTTPLEIKKKIEEDFSIPSCVQTLHYQSMILKDSEQFLNTHFRSGDTFTVDYPAEAECKVIQNVIQWLKEFYELLKSIEEHDQLLFSLVSKSEDVIEEGENSGLIEALSATLFVPWGDKEKLTNCFYFQQEGGIIVLTKIYSVLVSKEWGHLGIDAEHHMDMEVACCQSIFNYGHTSTLLREVVQLGGLEMCMKTLLRRQLRGEECDPNGQTYVGLFYSLSLLCNLSELPECQVPISTRTEVIDQTLAVALHPYCECRTAMVSVNVILNLIQSPETHVSIVREEVVEKILEIQKMFDEQSLGLFSSRSEDGMEISALKFYTSTALAQIGLGSPYLLLDRIPLHLLQQILDLMSDTLSTVSPAELRKYEQEESLDWGTFRPYFKYLYKPSPIETVNCNTKEASSSVDVGDKSMIRDKLHISCCNILLHGLENALGREVHLEILIKEGLLDYTMCLPAVLPGECQPRARSLVNELGKHRQLQPPSLCTLAKAHIAKTFCGLQPVMEIKSIGEFLRLYFD